MPPSKLSQEEIAARLAGVPGWALIGGKLQRELEFRDFVQAFSFMSALALVAEAKNHHPEWTNVYNRVRVAWTTHDAGGITELDFEMAAKTSALAGGA